MKRFRCGGGEFSARPYYKDEEIESICLGELRSLDLLPGSPAPIRIDRFIEKRFDLAPEYDDLDEGILGLTVFGKRGVEAVIVARALDAEGTKVSERRIRSTVQMAPFSLVSSSTITKESSPRSDWECPRTIH